MECAHRIPKLKPPQQTNDFVETFIEEKFVDLAEYPNIFQIEPHYYSNNMHGAIPNLYVRESVFDKLIEVSKYLPRGYKLCIFDAWRPLAVQMEMFERLYKKIQKENPTYNEGQLIEEVTKVISSPSTNTKHPYIHSTGGAVDVSISNDSGHKLDMGTDYAFFSEISATNYFEQFLRNKNVRNNRRFLYDLMTSVGFTNSPAEWWHYDYGNFNWAYYKKENVIYQGLFNKTDIVNIHKDI